MAKENKPVVAMRWLAEGKEDTFARYCDRPREDLPMADFSDDELANYAFMWYNRSDEEEVAIMLAQVDRSTEHVPKIAFMTAVKERIRWLTRQLAIAQGIYPGRALAVQQPVDLGAGTPLSLKELVEKYSGNMTLSGLMEAEARLHPEGLPDTQGGFYPKPDNTPPSSEESSADALIKKAMADMERRIKASSIPEIYKGILIQHIPELICRANPGQELDPSVFSQPVKCYLPDRPLESDSVELCKPIMPGVAPSGTIDLTDRVIDVKHLPAGKSLDWDKYDSLFGSGHESRSASKSLVYQPVLAHSEYFNNLQKELGKAALDRMPEGLKRLAETVAPEFRHRKYMLLHDNNIGHLLTHFGLKKADLLNELRLEELVKNIGALLPTATRGVILAALGRPNTTGLIAFDAYVCVCVDLLMEADVYVPFCGDFVGLTGTNNQPFIAESKYHPSGKHVNYPTGRVPDPLDNIQLLGESEHRLYGSVGVGEKIQMEPRPLDYDKTNAHTKWFDEFGQLSEKLGVNSMVANVPQLASRCERLIKLVPECNADMFVWHASVRVALGLTNDSYVDRMSALREVVRRVNEGIAISQKNVRELFGEEWKEEDPIDTMSKTVMPTKGIGKDGNKDGNQ